MSSTAPLPKIQGKKDKDRAEVEDRVEEQEVLEQATQMDLVKPDAVDETPYSRDIVRPPQETIVEKAKKEEPNQTKHWWEASLPKARAARAEKARLRKLQNQQAAQGAPIPHGFEERIDSLHKKFEQFDTTLQDLKKLIAHEAPLQSSGIVPDAVEQPRAQPIAAYPSTYQVAIPRDHPKTLPLSTSGTRIQHTRSPRRRSRSRSPISEQERFTRKFQKAMDHFQFQTQEVRQRTEQEYGLESKGPKPSVILF